MVEPLGDEWMRQLSTVTSAIKADPAVRLIIQQTVTGETPIQWHVKIADGAACTVAGAADQPDITLTADRTTAIGMATGRISAQRAFLEGALRISGQINLLIEARSVLDEISAALWAARESESFDD